MFRVGATLALPFELSAGAWWKKVHDFCNIFVPDLIFPFLSWPYPFFTQFWPFLCVSPPHLAIISRPLQKSTNIKYIYIYIYIAFIHVLFSFRYENKFRTWIVTLRPRPIFFSKFENKLFSTNCPGIWISTTGIFEIGPVFKTLLPFQHKQISKMSKME